MSFNGEMRKTDLESDEHVWPREEDDRMLQNPCVDPVSRVFNLNGCFPLDWANRVPPPHLITRPRFGLAYIIYRIATRSHN